MEERRRRIATLTGLEDGTVEQLSPGAGLSEAQADMMVENAVGVLGLPLGVCVNMRLDGIDVLVPMAIEEPSVVAACSYASKLLRAGGGVTSTVSDPLMVGQIQVLEVEDPQAAEAAVLSASPELLELADSKHHRLTGAGGGARSMSVRHLPPADVNDPCGAMLVIHLLVDVQEAMGANAINSMCERLAPRIEELTGGRVALRILTNLSDQRTVTVVGRVPLKTLDGKGAANGLELAKRIEEASVFAERDPYRACTHNKGVMNGVDAALIALGQDWRAVEAGAHAFAARDGRYTAMASWRVEDEHLVGRLTIPMAVGTVGGVAKVHPVVGVAQKIAKIESAAQLGAICASVGLAQNLGALRALAAEGIQKGHMRLHARNIAVEAGADSHEVEEVARRIAERGRVSGIEAERTLLEMRGDSELPEAGPVDCEPRTERPPTPTNGATFLRALGDPIAVTRPTASPPNTTLSNTTPSPVEHIAEDIVEDVEKMEQAHEARPMEGTILVTGAAGHLGSNLTRRLLKDGHEVRVLLRHGSNNAGVEGLNVEKAFGDLRNLDEMRAAVAGCKHVFHCAAKVSTVDASEDLKREIYDCNVMGTRNLLQAASEENVTRVVVTGSFSAVGYDLDDRSAAGNEDMPFWPFEELLPYARTKVLVEHETLKAVVNGLDAVICTSCAILGPNDHKPSRMGQTLMDFANGKLPAYIPGGFDFVSSEDIVDGHIRAMERGRTGQKYICSTTYLELEKIMELFEEVSGQPRPKLRLSPTMMAGVAEVSSFVLNRFFPDKPQRFTPGAVRILRKRRHADTKKAQRELGYRPGSVRSALHAAYADFARRGLVPARPGTVAGADPTSSNDASKSAQETEVQRVANR